MNGTPIGWLIAAVGIFSVCGALFQWGFFMNHRKARNLIRFIGVTGSRIFYTVIGMVVTVLGVLLAVGVIQDKG